MNETLKKWQERANVADRNRRRFPLVTEAIDKLREVFPDARLLYAREDGKEIGVYLPGVPFSEQHVSNRQK